MSFAVFGGDEPAEDNNSGLTILDLLIQQRNYAELLENADLNEEERQDFQSGLDAVNTLLREKGRCAVCGLQHGVGSCQRVWNEGHKNG